MKLSAVVEDRHHRGLEALGLVHGEDADGVRIAGPRHGQVGLLAGGLRALLEEAREPAQGEDAQVGGGAREGHHLPQVGDGALSARACP